MTTTAPDLSVLIGRMAGDEKHPAAAESTVDVLWVLYDRVLDISPATAQDPRRDRFLLSKGHGPMAYHPADERPHLGAGFQVLREGRALPGRHVRAPRRGGPHRRAAPAALTRRAPRRRGQDLRHAADHDAAHGLDVPGVMFAIREFYGQS